MISIVLKCTNHFGYNLKDVLFNVNTRVVSYATQHCKIFIMSVRSVMSVTQNENEQNLLNYKFDTITKYIEKHNLVPKTKIFNLISFMKSAKDIDDYQSLLLLHWCNEITDCLPLDKIIMAKSLWLILTITNFKIQTTHYNKLLILYVTNEYEFSPKKLLMEMKDKKIYPDNDTYLICIKYYCMKGDINKALMLLQNIKKFNLHMIKSILNSLMLGCSYSGDIQTLNEILKIMKQKKLNLTTDMYAAIMCTYAKLNSISEIIKIIEECKSKNLYFTNKDILNVIYTFAENNNIKDIHNMYEYLIKKNNILYNEVQIILKLISIDQIDIAINAILHITSNNNYFQRTNILRLILIHMINNMETHKIVKLFSFLKNDRMFKKCLLISLEYSLTINNDLSFYFLKMCKVYCIIKPHFFWPLLHREANKYNFQGILNILVIMVSNFNILPCVDTITDYVLPYSFGEIYYVRNLLMEHKVSEIVINHAYVLSKLKKQKLSEVSMYMQTFKGEYFYKIIAHDLRYASVCNNEISNFIYISSQLVENTNLHLTLKSNNKSHASTIVPIDRQLCDFMIDFPSHKMWMKKVINLLAQRNISLSSKTANKIDEFLHKNTICDQMNVPKDLSNKIV